MSQNHYQILGVAPTASIREIKLAYKRLAIRYHPDKHGGSALHEEAFKAVAAAYHILGDPGRRAQYDGQLLLAARRAEEARRQQQFRNQGQRVYGVPMPPPAPLRTRRPAGSHERHYRTIPRQRPRFTRRDAQLLGAVLIAMLLFGLAVKAGVDWVTADRQYQRGLGAYGRREWSAAHSFFSEAIRLRPRHGGALRRRGELEELMLHNPRAAAIDYQAALNAVGTASQRAELLVRLGLCYRTLQHPAAAVAAVQQALVADSGQVRARLLRGEARLFARHYAAARRDFDAALQQTTRVPAHVSARLLLYRGLTHFKQKDYRAARADYWQVLTTYPNQGQVYFLLGRVSQQEGNRAEACEFFRRALVQGYQFAAQAQDTTCRQP